MFMLILVLCYGASCTMTALPYSYATYENCAEHGKESVRAEMKDFGAHLRLYCVQVPQE